MALKIFITSGAGYLGSVLTPSLLQNGSEVTVLDNFMSRPNRLTDCCPSASFDLMRGKATLQMGDESQRRA